MFLSTLLTLLTLSFPLTHTHPLNTTTTSLLHLHPRTTRPLPGTCPTPHLPTESTYTTSYTTFCTTHIPPGYAHQVSESHPLIFTHHLTAHDNTPLDWIFSIGAADGDSPGDPTGFVTQELCLRSFRDFLETERAGGLGGAYCVVGGTGGDKEGTEGMSGEGVVLVMGGKVTMEISKARFGSFVFETRQKRGDKV